MRVKTVKRGNPLTCQKQEKKEGNSSYQGRFNCLKEGQRKKAQKSNTSKGTMNVELNGTKPFLQLVILYFVFVSVLKVVVVLLHSAFTR